MFYLYFYPEVIERMRDAESSKKEIVSSIE